MRIKHLRTRMILLLVGLLALVLGAFFAAVHSATDSSAERQARQQLQVGGDVFIRLLELRGQGLEAATQILAADFGFREAVASGDLPTIRSALVNQARRIDADEAWFFDAEGITRVSSAVTEGRSFSLISAIQRLDDNVFVAVINDQPYLIVDADVMVPLLLGQVVMAFRLDVELAKSMKRLTGLEVTFDTGQAGGVVDRVGTLQLPQGVIGLEAPASSSLTLNQHVFLATQITLLEQQGFSIKTQLLSPMAEVIAISSRLERKLLFITLIALALSSLAAFVMASSLSRPVSLLAEAARRIGQGDYSRPALLKRSDELGLLAESIDDMRQEIALRERQIAHNIYHDPLTGLGNWTKIRDELTEIIARGGSGVLVAFDLAESDDLLKAHGQAFSSLVIQASADRIWSKVPDSSMLAYHPGQGFLLILSGVDADQSTITADNLISALSERMVINELEFNLVWLAGIVAWPQHSEDPDELLRQVAIAAADARPGLARIAIYQAQRDQDYMRRLRLIHDIHFAPQLRELSVVYQPKLDLASGEVRQVEALIRWHHSELGFISPDEFILLAEQTGSIHKLTQWILEAVASQMRIWADKGVELQVAINVSALDLDNEGFADQVAAVLQAHNINPVSLAVEVTESALMINPARSLRSLHRLRDMGISLAVDDYGTGYSSLAMLKSLPVQDLKIDKSFVLELTEGSDDAVIVRSTIELAHNMGLKVIAEGVENAVSLEWLRALGCDTAQGYFISRPIAALDLETWLQANRTTYKKLEHS
jgi:EAL domain-containing protein (putative c-di-GMP-specific phosphodiesterase class I)/GGDEF domain-containing protein